MSDALKLCHRVAEYGAFVLGSQSPESRSHHLGWLETYFEGLAAASVGS